MCACPGTTRSCRDGRTYRKTRVAIRRALASRLAAAHTRRRARAKRARGVSSLQLVPQPHIAIVSVCAELPGSDGGTDRAIGFDDVMAVGEPTVAEVGDELGEAAVERVGREAPDAD